MPQARSPRKPQRARIKCPTKEVYFIQGETLRLIKIGLASSAKERCAALQVCSPDRLRLIGSILTTKPEALEAELHGRFRQLRAHGEWFRPGDDLLAYITTAAQGAEAAKEDLVRAGLLNTVLPAFMVRL